MSTWVVLFSTIGLWLPTALALLLILAVAIILGYIWLEHKVWCWRQRNKEDDA